MSITELGITLDDDHPSTHQLQAIDLPGNVRARVVQVLSELLAAGDLNMIDYGAGKGVGLAVGLNMAGMIDDDQQMHLEQLFQDSAVRAREDW